jgi:hypothetical protein
MPGTDRRVAGVLRRMRYAPLSSYAECLVEGHVLRERTTPKIAGRVARNHTRETGHATRAAHVQIVDYEKE